MTLILFSYSVRISNVSSPSNARLWICDMRLWFKLRISKWCKFLIAFDGAFCSWFCDTSSWVSPFPAHTCERHQSLIKIPFQSTGRSFSQLNESLLKISSFAVCKRKLLTLALMHEHNSMTKTQGMWENSWENSQFYKLSQWAVSATCWRKLKNPFPEKFFICSFHIKTSTSDGKMCLRVS